MAWDLARLLGGLDDRILALGVARMADAVGNSFLIIVLPLYIHSRLVTGETYGLTIDMVTGIVLSLFGFLNSGFQPLTGWLSDRAGKRKAFIIGGLALMVATNLTYVLVRDYVGLVVVRSLQGIAAGITIPATVALVSELSTRTTRGGAMGTFNTFRLLGFGAGPVAAGAVVAAGPYRIAGATVPGFHMAFVVAAGTAVVGLALVAWLVDDPEAGPEEAGEAPHLPEVPDRVLGPILALAAATMFMAVGVSLLETIQTHVNARLGQGPFLFSLEFSAFLLTLVVFQAPIGRWADRYGRRPFLLGGTALLIPGTLAVGLAVAPWQMFAARFVQGLAGAMIFAPALAVAGDLAGRETQGRHLAVLTMGFGLGLALGPLTAGFLVGFGYEVPFVFGAVLAGVALALVGWLVPETGGTAPAEAE